MLANSPNSLFVVAIGRDWRDQDRLLTFVVISIAIGMLTRRRLRSRLPVARERLRFGYLSWSHPPFGHFPCAGVALWPQYSSFRWQNQFGPKLHSEPPLPLGYDVAEFRWGRHSYGACYGSENCTRRGKKRAADLSTSTPTWRCRNSLGPRDHVFFQRGVGR